MFYKKNILETNERSGSILLFGNNKYQVQISRHILKIQYG